MPSQRLRKRMSKLNIRENYTVHSTVYEWPNQDTILWWHPFNVILQLMLEYKPSQLTRLAIMLSCKWCFNVIRKADSYRYLGRYELWPSQVRCLNYIQSMFEEVVERTEYINGYREEYVVENDIVHLRAPMGYGKTVVGLAIATRCEGVVVIICKPSVFSTWEEQVKKFLPGQYSSGIKSAILSTLNPQHRTLLDQYQSGRTGIILATTRTLHHIKDIIADLCILDEAHVYQSITDNLVPRHSKVLLLSANRLQARVDCLRVTVKRPFVRRTETQNVARIPTECHIWVATRPLFSRVQEDTILRSGKMKVKTTCNTNTLIAEVLVIITLSIENGARKIVVYLDSKERQDIMCDYYKRHFTNMRTKYVGPSYNVYKYVRSLTSVENFRSDESCSILLITQANCEGLTLCGDTLVVVCPELHVSTKYTQICGRLERLNNEVSKLTIYMLTEWKHYYRCMYYEARRLDRNLPEADARTYYITEKVCQSLGYTRNTITSGDIARIVCLLVRDGSRSMLPTTLDVDDTFIYQLCRHHSGSNRR